jgi:hypothetical protein
MQAAGLKIHCVEMRKITAAANAYVQEHREELIEEAAAKIATWPGLRKLAEQEAKAIRKTSLQQAAPSFLIAIGAWPDRRRQDVAATDAGS